MFGFEIPDIDFGILGELLLGHLDHFVAVRQLERQTGQGSTRWVQGAHLVRDQRRASSVRSDHHNTNAVP